MPQLYRHFDEKGALLYVGTSLNSINRLGQHNQNADWYGLIRRVEIEEFGTAHEARLAEQSAIESEKPLCNIQHRGPRSTAPQQTETEFRAWRRRLRLTQDKAADALGRSRRQVQSYDGGDEEPPRIVALAMVALEDHPETITHGG